MHLRSIIAALALILSPGIVQGQPSLAASPPVINAGDIFGVTWNGAPAKAGDWMGLYTAGSPDTNPWLWVKAEAPSYTWTLPATVPANASYEFRLFCCSTFQKLGSSNRVWVQDPYAPQPPPQEPEPEPEPDPQPQPQPGTVLYDYTNAVWYPGPVLNARQFSEGAVSQFQGAVNYPKGGQINYVTTPALGPLPAGGRIVFTMEVISGPLVGTEEPISAGQIFVYFQAAGDDWRSDGKRWWSHQSAPVAKVADGRWTLDVPLTYEHWCSVFTCSTPEAFIAALAQVATIGFTGGSNSKGLGLQDLEGDAWLRIVEYSVVQ
jgi:hypothetical protein